MAKYEQYAEYKESEVKWLEKVPSHWQPVPIKYLASEKDTLFLDGDWIESKDISDSGIRYITTGNVGEGQYKEQGTGFISDQVFQKLNCSEVFEQDILISRLNLPIGRACLVPNLNNRIVTSVDNVILRPDIIYCKRFLVHLFSSSEYFHNTANLARGATMQRISRGLLGNIRISLPEKVEQTQIANFLDHETAQIDTLVEKQQTLIQLLKEKRQAVISHAVTKGLNPNAPMKDSGVEWLGEVPEHWDVSSLKHHVDTVNGFGFSSSDVCDEGVPFIRAGNIKNKSITPTDLYLPQKVVDKYERVILFEGDIVISMVGSDPKILKSAVGQIGVVPKSMAGAVPNQNIVILREKSDKLLKRFLFYTLCSDSYRNHLNVFSHKLANQSIISSSLIINAKFMLPMPDEQCQIVDFLDKRLVKMDEVIEKNYISLELLKERRTALISAAVTGKIDVRGWQAPE